jgi:hypothetical protein
VGPAVSDGGAGPGSVGSQKLRGSFLLLQVDQIGGINWSLGFLSLFSFAFWKQPVAHMFATRV